MLLRNMYSHSSVAGARARRRITTGASASRVQSTYEIPKIVDLLKQADALPETSRIGAERLSASNVVGGDICPRLEALMRRFGETVKVSAGSNQRLVWAYGRAAEKHVRDQLIQTSAANMVGVWVCRCGFCCVVGRATENVCDKCNTKINVYEELNLVDEERNIGGHPDLIFVNDAGEATVIEIKSIKDFSKLTKAQTVHIAQALIYAEMLKASPHVMAASGITSVKGVMVLYVNKAYSFGPDGSYRQFGFTLGQQDPLLESAYIMVGEGFSLAESIAEYERTKILPERLPTCNGPTAMRAAKCAGCTLCFSLPAIGAYVGEKASVKYGGTRQPD